MNEIIYNNIVKSKKDILKELREEIKDGLLKYGSIDTEQFDMHTHMGLTIFIDTNGSCKDYTGIPHLYVANTYNYTSLYDCDFYIISIEEMPQYLYYPKKPRVYPEDLYEVIDFIRRSYNELIMLATEKITCLQFIHMYNSIYESVSTHMLNEMSILMKEDSGLCCNLYIDTTGAGEKSGHNGSPRLKFGYGTDSKHNDFKPMLLTYPYETPDGIPKGMKQKDVEQIRKFVAANSDNLIKVYYNELQFTKFVETYMVTFDKHGNKISNDTATGLPYYNILKNAGYDNISFIQFRDSKFFNYIYTDTEEILYKDENGKPYQFINCIPFKKPRNVCYAIVKDINYVDYVIYPNGKIKVHEPL